MIGHVDCTAGDNINKELCNSNGVNGFPTLNIYKDGVKVRRIFSLLNTNDGQHSPGRGVQRQERSLRAAGLRGEALSSEDCGEGSKGRVVIFYCFLGDTVLCVLSEGLTGVIAFL